MQMKATVTTFLIPLLLFLFNELGHAQCIDGHTVSTPFGETVNVCTTTDQSFVWVDPSVRAGHYAYAITDENGTILDVTFKRDIDFRGVPEGTCRIYGVSWWGGFQSPIGENISSASFAEFCSIVSDNFITVIRSSVEASSISLVGGETETSICAGDGITDPLDVVVEDGAGSLTAWVITDDKANILALPDGPPFDLEGAGPGTCLIWHLTFEDGLIGAEVGANAGDLGGCFALSNPITVNRNGVSGGELTFAGGSTFQEICAGDGIGDPLEVTLTGATGSNSAWVITDTLGNILALPMAPPFDLDGAGPGVCLIWNLSYEGEISGAEVGLNANDLSGTCFSLSNPITVDRNGVSGGELAFTDGSILQTICAGDGIGDPLEVTLTGATGSNSAWVITDTLGNILALPMAPTV